MGFKTRSSIYFTTSATFASYLGGKYAPQSAQKNINLQILSKLPVPQLTLSEQRREIVEELDALQAEEDALKLSTS